MGGATRAIATEIAEKLIRDKATQAAGHATVWILGIDMMTIVDADEFADALLSHPDRPANWERLYLLPATDRSNVIAISLR